MHKIEHISAELLLADSFLLGKKLYQMGIRPKYAVSLWRGGTPIGLGVDSYYRMQGIPFRHTTIATSLYANFERKEQVIVKGLEGLIQKICYEDTLLIIDDVYESGNTIDAVIRSIRNSARENAPNRILVATLHYKDISRSHNHEVVYLKEMAKDAWIDYPHEIADFSDNEEMLINKSNTIHKILSYDYYTPVEDYRNEKSVYVSSQELLELSFKLGVNVFNARDFHPDFLIALWPGGIQSGLPVHETIKYLMKKSNISKSVDHISVNVNRESFESGLTYLTEKINRKDNILIIDTTFRSGQMVNEVIFELKKRLRRNVNENHIRVASVFYNENDNSTWITQPVITKPHYYIKKVNYDVIYPHSIYKLKEPYKFLENNYPSLSKIFR